MNTKGRRTTPLSEKEEKLLAAYFDGELDRGKVKELKNQLALTDGDLQAELDGLRLLRSEVRSWHHEYCVKRLKKAGPASIWTKIEAEVTAINDHGKRSLGFSLPGFSRIFDFVQNRQVIAACVAAAAVLIVVVARSPEQSVPGAGMVASNQPMEEPVLNVASLDDPGVREVISVAAPFAMPDSVTNQYRQLVQKVRTEAHAPVEFGRMIDRNFVLGGLRASGAEIDWIRSNRSFHIVGAGNRAAPPIIWLAKNRQLQPED